MTDPGITSKSFAPTPSTGPSGFGTTRVIVGSVLCFLSLFSLPRGLSLLLLGLLRPEATTSAATALGIAIFGAALLTAGILLIVSGAKRRRAARTAQ
ncbi:hypothetical protein [Cryobacterium cryoconiti]|uniref:Uncharacterized protein n=1 Tax=Cryobacterium cryoconiti TaxID=1259239 RepID=A0A4Y8JYX1_9MICO|nr:hypothetical protein [Cryobacterium cryoconiti]TFD29917.1 hypothetical protein E3T49_08670 [Cryobacterium cryoconiti]